MVYLKRITTTLKGGYQMNYYNMQERALANELNHQQHSEERRAEIYKELTLIRQYRDMSLKEKQLRERSLGKEIISPSFTPTRGQQIYRELQLVRQGR